MSFIKDKLAEDKGFARVPALDRLAAAFPHEARALADQRMLADSHAGCHCVSLTLPMCHWAHVHKGF